MTGIGAVIGWKFNHQNGMSTADGVIIDFPGGIPSAEDQSTWATEYEAYKVMADIREKRNTALAATDWAALPDSPTMSSAMTTYRTALRNYPATYTADNSAAWPTLGE
jgi:hypothetical protein